MLHLFVRCRRSEGGVRGGEEGFLCSSGIIHPAVIINIVSQGSGSAMGEELVNALVCPMNTELCYIIIQKLIRLCASYVHVYYETMVTCVYTT